MSSAEPPNRAPVSGPEASNESRDSDAQKPPARKRGWVRTLVDLLIGLFLAFWLGEFLVIQIWGEQAKFPRRVVEAPWGLRYNDPGSSYRHKSADVNIRLDINNQGMRASTDYEYRKPEGTIRIVSLGDSFTIGYEVEDEESFSRVVEQGLRGAGHEVEVLNSGVSGFSTAEAILYLERELIHYAPDVVVISFFPNDFVDNIRTNLFVIDNEGELVQESDTYLPLGRLGNTLNSNPVFNIFSEYSNSFTLAKEQLTLSIKEMMVARSSGEMRKAGSQELQVIDPGAKAPYQGTRYQMDLLVALLDRLYEFCRARDILLVVQVIPAGGLVAEGSRPEFPLVDPFPYEGFDSNRPGLAVLPMLDLLQPHFGQTELVHGRSHRHWTPFSHRLSGNALTELMLAWDGIGDPASGSDSAAR